LRNDPIPALKVYVMMQLSSEIVDSMMD